MVEDNLLEGISQTVAETLLITLFCRALETQSQNPIIKDHKAIEIIDKLIDYYDFNQFRKARNFKKLVVIMSLRAKQFDLYVQQFLENVSDGVIVNIGCGLDTRYERLNLIEKNVEWFDLDLPEVISLKKTFFKETDRYQFISTSVLDFEWFHLLDKNKGPILFLAEGVFMYFHEEDVKNLILNLQKNFPGSELACEVVNVFWTKRMQKGRFKHLFQKRFNLGGDITFNWGIKNALELEKWSSGIQLLDEWTYFEENEKKLGWMRIFKYIPFISKSQWVVHYKLDDFNEIK